MCGGDHRGNGLYIGKLADKDVVVVRSEKERLTLRCTQVLADKYHVSGYHSGIAGSLKAQIDIGDIVLPATLQHDMDATGFGYAVGQIPRVDTLAFAADEALIELAKSCCKDVNPDINTHVGRVVSGDQFISDHGKKEWLVSTFDGYCTEMEGAAIAQASYLNGIPFLIVRAISDKADNSANMDYETL